NCTGITLRSPGASGCSWKQKHSIFMKWRAASPGDTEGTAVVTIGSPVRFSTTKDTTCRSPGLSLMRAVSGAKSTATAGSWVATNSTLISRPRSMRSGAGAATLSVLPLMPVMSQNTSYSGTSAKPKANIATQASSSLLIRLRCTDISRPPPPCPAGSLHHRRSVEGVVGRGRRHFPFQPLRAFPHLGGGALADAAHAAHHAPHEQQLRQAEQEAADAHEGVEVGKLQRVVGDAARHAGQADEVHREEQH